jgi:hypothetical protein
MVPDLDLLTGLTEGQRQQALRWWITLAETERLRVYKHGVKWFFIFKVKTKDKGEEAGTIIKYAGLLRAIREEGWDTITTRKYRVATEKQFKDFERLRDLKIVAIKRGRPPLKLKQVQSYWGEIVESRAKGNSFATIAKYLKESHKIDITEVYLRCIYNKLHSDKDSK